MRGFFMSRDLDLFASALQVAVILMWTDHQKLDGFSVQLRMENGIADCPFELVNLNPL